MVVRLIGTLMHMQGGSSTCARKADRMATTAFERARRPSAGREGFCSASQRNYSYAQVWQCAPCVDHHRLISIHSTLSLSAFMRTARLLYSACACFSCIFLYPHPYITRSEITAGARCDPRSRRLAVRAAVRRTGGSTAGIRARRSNRLFSRNVGLTARKPNRRSVYGGVLHGGGFAQSPSAKNCRL